MTLTKEEINRNARNRLAKKRRENPEFTIEENRKRTFRDIKNGVIPLKKTVDKYHITLEQVNQLRAEGGLQPLESISDIVERPKKGRATNVAPKNMPKEVPIVAETMPEVQPIMIAPVTPEPAQIEKLLGKSEQISRDDTETLIDDQDDYREDVDMIDENHVEYSELVRKNEELERENKELKSENKELKSENKELKSENKEFEQRAAEFEHKVADFERRIKKLKEEHATVTEDRDNLKEENARYQSSEENFPDYQTLSYEDIKKYFDGLVEQGIVKKPTAKKHMSDIKLLMEEVKDTTKDFITMVNTGLVKPAIIKHYEENKKGAESSIDSMNNMRGSVWSVWDHYPRLRSAASKKSKDIRKPYVPVNEYGKIDERKMDELQTWMRQLKSSISAKTAAKTTKRIPKWDKVLKPALLKNTAKNSSEYLIVKMYDQFPFRDDLGNVKLIDKVKDATDPHQNYLIYEKEPVIILRDYKTHVAGQDWMRQLSPEIYDILEAQGKKPGDYMISLVSNYKKPKGKLGPLIGEMLRNAGYYVPNFVVKMLRVSKINEMRRHADLSDPEVVEQLAADAMHSATTQSSAYVRDDEENPDFDIYDEKYDYDGAYPYNPKPPKPPEPKFIRKVSKTKKQGSMN